MSVQGFHEFEQKGWQSVAHRYASSWALVTTQAVSALLDAAGVGKGTRLLDLACGPGFVAGEASKRGVVATGLDFSPGMLEDARRRYPEVDFIEGDAQKLKFASATFDAVVSNFGILHLAEPERAIAEAFRVLKPGGRFAFTVWDTADKAVAFGIALAAVQEHGNPNVVIPAGPPFFRFSDPAESKRTLAAAGFLNPEVRQVPQTWKLNQPEELFDVLYNSSVRNAALLRAQTPDAVKAIQESLRKAVEARGGILPMPAILASGEKPNH